MSNECKFCSRLFQYSRYVRKHQLYCKCNPEYIDKVHSDIEWSKIRTGGNQYTKAIELGQSKPGITDIDRANRANRTRQLVWTAERKAALSRGMKIAVAHAPESYTSANRERTKQIEKYDIKFQGHWELEFYEWCLRHNISVERCIKRFRYEYNGTRSYNPDFYIPSRDLYVEVKGYMTPKDEAKWRDFPLSLRIIRESDIKAIRTGCFELDGGEGDRTLTEPL